MGEQTTKSANWGLMDELFIRENGGIRQCELAMTKAALDWSAAVEF
jgi:hypothetical protein